MKHAVLAMLIACGGERSDDSSLEAAQTEVRNFFAAATRDDCATVRALMPTMTSDAACAEYLKTWHEDGIVLVAVQGASRDGRDARAIIVRVRMQTKGKHRDVLVRAIHDGGRWSLVF